MPEPTRILLVEDSRSDARLLEATLQDAGVHRFRLTHVERLAEALAALAGGGFDVVLLDLHLPDSQGLDTLAELEREHPGVPVVVLTGLDDEDLAVRAVQAGAQDYLMKGEVAASTLARAMRYAVERQRAERRLAQLALRDPLTGLPNRVLFADRLEQAIARVGRHTTTNGRGHELALMFVDLDGFKEVNDSLGHLAGDELLVDIADRLRAELRSSDTVARLGGDEFVVLCEDVLGADAALVLAQRLGQVIAQPSALEAGEATVTAAIGVALAVPEEDAGSLLRRADAAMYAAKRDGHGRCALARSPA